MQLFVLVQPAIVALAQNLLAAMGFDGVWSLEPHSVATPNRRCIDCVPDNTARCSQVLDNCLVLARHSSYSSPQRKATEAPLREYLKPIADCRIVAAESGFQYSLGATGGGVPSPPRVMSR